MSPRGFVRSAVRRTRPGSAQPVPPSVRALEVLLLAACSPIAHRVHLLLDWMGVWAALLGQLRAGQRPPHACCRGAVGRPSLQMAVSRATEATLSTQTS